MAASQYGDNGDDAPRLRWWQRQVLRAVAGAAVPRHVAFVMDGNRRFAKRVQVPRQTGHAMGFDTLLRVLECCLELGVRCVSVYAFSIENFKRSDDEVAGLMQLALAKFDELRVHSRLLVQHDVRVRILGDTSLLDEQLRVAIAALEQSTAAHTRATLNICFAYTARDELTHAVRAVCADVGGGRLSPDDVDAAAVEARLFTAGCPPVDLLVRTSGEHRLSDFLMWQVGESLLQFEDILWPDVNFWHLLLMILQYQLSVLGWI